MVSNITSFTLSFEDYEYNNSLFYYFELGIINMHPRTLEEYFYESCIIPEGDDIDDEDFKIRVIYKIFEKSTYSSSEPIEVTGNMHLMRIVLKFKFDSFVDNHLL